MKVVVALDGSKFSRWGIEWLSRLPFTSLPQVLAVHVIDPGAVRAPVMVQPPVLAIAPYLQAEIKKLEDAATVIKAQSEAMLRKTGLKGRVVIEHGPVAPTVLRHAVKRGLVTVGHRGLDPIDWFLLGSVSEKVVHHAPCSVFLAKQPARRLRRLLLATDGSRPSAKALDFLLRYCRPSKATDIEVAVVHVMPLLRYPELKTRGPALLARYAERLTAAGYAVRQFPELGNPADQIIQTAEKLKSDLVVCGAKGSGAVARFLLGSVSTKLIHHAPCSVLVVR
jgi:nucleotide-binding universal stress UspA family protein